MPRPCHDRHPPSPETCHFCKLAATRADYRELWEESPPGGNVTIPRQPGWLKFQQANSCVHRGLPTGREVGCAACGGKETMAAVYDCYLHDECTRRASKEKGLAFCSGCKDRVAAPPPLPEPEQTVRHLIYHVYPLPGPVWRRNLDQLKQRINLFNGRRIVAIAVDDKTEHPGVVRDYLKGDVTEFLEVSNRKSRREVVSLVPMLELLKTDDSAHVLFYAQAKGVTHPLNDGVTAHAWSDAMYSTLLDYWPLMHGLLQQYPVVGSFLKKGQHFDGSRSKWHWSGSFCWYRVRDLFARNWRDVDRQWWGVEAYPSLHFHLEEAGSVFTPANVGNLYDVTYWREKVAPMLASWKQRHAADFREWPR